jgi:predicted unusual protein kinase regulating ubiquinone biosynthesis (AarF/ABC1/UbiB family)
VYDKLSGQLKPTAWDTITQECSGIGEILVGLQEEVGGGSLMTVFKSMTKWDGRELAVKVLNPNAGDNTNMAFNLLFEVFKAVALEDESFAPAIDLLYDIKEWILNDINFKGFLRMDEEFRAQANGFGTGRYRIKVPLSFSPSSEAITGRERRIDDVIQPQNFVLEEWIDGTNLTNVEKLKSEGHDVKEIVSLVVKEFFDQLQQGKFILSDIHAGNIRVTKHNEVVILDRNYYLSLKPEDQQFLITLPALIGDMTLAAEAMMNYFSQKNISVEPDQRLAIATEVQEISSTFGSDPTERILRLSTIFRKHGIRPPIEITLIVKDFFFLDRMAKKVGFTGIVEAFVS